MRRIFSFACATVAYTSGAAIAADISAPTAYDWSGVYVGVHAGYDKADVSYDFASITEGYFNENRGTHFSEELDGFVGGGQVGFNWQYENLVLGLEGAFTWVDFDETSTSPFYPGSDEFESKVDWIAAITPRVGLTVENVMFYAKGGVAFADITARIQDNNAELFVETQKKRAGWTIGGGAEYALSENWIVGAEANYYDFGSFYAGENTTTFEGAPGIPSSDHDVSTTMWSVLARVSYKFN